MKTILEIAYFESIQRYCVLAKREDGYFEVLAGYETKRQAENFIKGYTNPKSLLERN